MTYRERREQRAERLRDWADKRTRDANDTFRAHEHYRGDHAFNFQPGHIPERARVIAREDRAHASVAVASNMASRADGIDRQLATSIYDDDPDAIERLEAKLVAMEARRDAVKAKRAATRKAGGAKLRAMSAWDREEVMRAAGAPQYEITNLGGRITSTRDRIARLKRERDHGPRDRIITARFDSECATCGATLTRGDTIRYNRQQGARCYPGCVTKEAAT